MDDAKTQSVSRTLERIAMVEMIVAQLRENPLPLSHLYIPILENMLRHDRRTVECVETGEPFLACEFTTPAEIMTAMGLHWYFHLERVMSAGALYDAHVPEDLQAVAALGVPSDICTAGRMTFYYLHAGILPKPTAYIPMVHPCDAMTAMHTAYSRHPVWRDVPMFVPDAPYHADAMSLDYYTDELRRSVDFITTHTGKTLDIARLRAVVEESNQAFALWQEYNSIRRAVPAPHGSTIPGGCVNMALSEGAGRPENTAWFASVVADAEQRVAEGTPEVPNQKIRLLWFDFPPMYHAELSAWMEQEWGAIIAMDMASNCPYEMVDTASEESIFRGLAARSLQHPVMIRQAHGTADSLVREMTRIVKDYRMDCVIYPAHMGHKDQSASIGLMREVCRGLHVPFLHIGLDNFDPSYTSLGEIKDKISQFFVATGLG